MGILKPAAISVVADDPATKAEEPIPEMVENTLNFLVKDGLQEGTYDFKVEVHLGSDATVLDEKIINATFNKRRTFKILYTTVSYNGDLPSGDFSNSYLLLKKMYPMQFNKNYWIAKPSNVIHLSTFSTVDCKLEGLRLLAQLATQRVIYNATQPPESKADYIVGILPDRRLTVNGCSNREHSVILTSHR